jgi:hypothetical protein
MDNFSSGFIVHISYLEEQNAKTLKNSPRGHFGGILGYFGKFFSFWDNFQILYFFIFYKLKKIMLEKKSEEKPNSCVNGPLCVFYFEIFMFFPAFRVCIMILKYFLI